MFNSKIPKIKNKGFTLLEMLIAVTVIAVGLIGVHTALARAVNQAIEVRKRFIAIYLGQEGIELIKNIRDGNWIEGVAWDDGLISCSSGCETDNFDHPTLTSYAEKYFYIDDADDFYKYIDSPGAGDVKTLYQRKITITEPETYKLDIKVELFWKFNGEDKTIEVDQNIYKWR